MIEAGKFAWLYKAKVIDVYDGDTITVEIDLGFDIRMKRKIRLYGINAPEMRGEEKILGTRTRNVLREWILDKEVVIESIKDKSGKFGRILGKVWFEQEHPNHPGEKFMMCANDMLVQSQLAKHAEY